MGHTVYASFVDPVDAEKAIEALLDHGVRTEDVSLVKPGDDETTPRFAEPVEGSVYGTDHRRSENDVAVATGAVVGYLKNLGIDEHVASGYGETIEAGGALLAVSLPSGGVDEEMAVAVLDKYTSRNVNRYPVCDSSARLR